MQLTCVEGRGSKGAARISDRFTFLKTFYAKVNKYKMKCTELFNVISEYREHFSRHHPVLGTDPDCMDQDTQHNINRAKYKFQ